MKVFLILSVIAMFSFAYVREDNNVIHMATSQSKVLVAGAAPISKINLDPARMEEYADNFIRTSNKQLDTTMFSQIIRNAASLDTSDWKDDELKNLFLVNAKEENISKNYLFRKLKLSSKKRIKFYTREINRYNSTEPSDRNIYYYSRPVYDNSGEYAIVQWNNGHSGMVGGGGIKLYHLEDMAWVEVGEVCSWKY